MDVTVPAFNTKTKRWIIYFPKYYSKFNIIFQINFNNKKIIERYNILLNKLRYSISVQNNLYWYFIVDLFKFWMDSHFLDVDVDNLNYYVNVNDYDVNVSANNDELQVEYYYFILLFLLGYYFHELMVKLEILFISKY